MKKWQPASVESGKKAKTHLSMQWTYLTAGNKKGVILITYAAVWAELSLRFCTNCSESIKLFNPKERFPVTFRVRWPWEPFASERWDTCFFLLFLFYRNHWLERDRGETGRQTGDKEGGYILSDLLRSSMLFVTCLKVSLHNWIHPFVLWRGRGGSRTAWGGRREHLKRLQAMVFSPLITLYMSNISPR